MSNPINQKTIFVPLLSRDIRARPYWSSCLPAIRPSPRSPCKGAAPNGSRLRTGALAVRKIRARVDRVARARRSSPIRSSHDLVCCFINLMGSVEADFIADLTHNWPLRFLTPSGLQVFQGSDQHGQRPARPVFTRQGFRSFAAACSIAFGVNGLAMPRVAGTMLFDIGVVASGHAVGGARISVRRFDV